MLSSLRYNEGKNQGPGQKVRRLPWRDRMPNAVATRGLEGIVATTSSICFIDGEAGVLSYRGIDIHELASKSTFEETTYLLWFGKLPNQSELTAFRAELAAARELDPRIIEFLRSVPPEA